MQQAQNKVDIRPAYMVQRLDDSKVFESEKYVFEKEVVGNKTVNNRKLVRTKHKGGFMVFFPRGHSIYVKDEQRLRELGYDQDPNLVDLNSGDIVGKLGIPLSLMETKMPVAAKSDGGK